MAEAELKFVHVDGLNQWRATCRKCGHRVFVPYEGYWSRHMAQVALNEECPNGEDNLYQIVGIETP